MSRALELLGTALRAVWGWKAAAESTIRLAMASFMVGCIGMVLDTTKRDEK